MGLEVTRRLIIPVSADLRNRLLIGATRPLLPTANISSWPIMQLTFRVSELLIDFRSSL